MRDLCSRFRDNPSPESIQIEAESLLRRLVFPMKLRSKEGLRLASRRSGFGFSTIKKIVYRERKLIPAHIHEALKLRTAEHERALSNTISQAVRAMQASGDDRYHLCIELLSESLSADGNPPARKEGES